MSQQAQLRTYTPEQVAEVYQVSKNTIYKMINEGRIKAKRINERVFRIPQTEVAWVEEGIDKDLIEMGQIDEAVLDDGAGKVLKDIRKSGYYERTK
ncbi:helix-turn-helix domain-containing protein [Candidatus Dojkabacteria bacterium]|nr:helix-turn-helix domain-containing protein [Candidatus Dojkabacteria bacterium]